MGRYLVRRLAYVAPIWLLISFFAFLLATLAPGDPAELLLRSQSDQAPSAEDVARVRGELGLDAPFVVRYARWVGHAVEGDLGRSYRTREPVLHELSGRFLVTAQLAVPALALALLIAVPLGVVCAVKHNSVVDHGSRLAALIGSSMPSYWLGYVLIVLFAVKVEWFPVAGRGGVRHMVLPALTLALGSSAILTRLTRASLLESLGDDYVRTARSKGLRERAVVVRHALRNSLIPVATVAGLRFGHLLGGAVFVETVFAWPGVGKFVVDSIYARDYPVIQGFVLFTGTVFLVVNLLVDLLYARLDPKVRLVAS